MFQNIPQVKLGIIAVSRDCFVISLSERRRKAIVESYAKKGGELYEVMTTVENENDMLKAVDEAKNAGCNALVVFLGNFGPETPETQVAQYFDGPVMYVGAAEESGDDLINGRGDAYCGMLNCSYNLNLRKIRAFIPENPAATAAVMAHPKAPSSFTLTISTGRPVTSANICTHRGELAAPPASRIALGFMCSSSFSM